MRQHKGLGFYFNCYKQKAPKITNNKEGGVRKERGRKMFSRLVLENKTRSMANIANEECHVCIGKDFVCLFCLFIVVFERMPHVTHIFELLLLQQSKHIVNVCNIHFIFLLQ